MSSSSLLATFLFALILAPLRGYGQTLEAVTSLAVFDADGNRIGAVEGFSSSFVEILLTVDGILFGIMVQANGFRGREGSLFFESGDCSGQPLLPATEGMLPGVFLDGATAYVENLDTPVQNLVAGSGIDMEGVCGFIGFTGRTFHDALEFVDLFADFTPPFTLKEDIRPKRKGRPQKFLVVPPGP